MLRYTAQVPQAHLVWECEMKMFSGGGYGAGSQVGLIFSWDGTAGGGGMVILYSGGALNPSTTGLIYSEINTQVTGGAQVAHNFNLDQWYRMTLVVGLPVIDIYLDGQYQTTFGAFTTENALLYLSLYDYNCHGGFRNAKSWHLSLP